MIKRSEYDGGQVKPVTRRAFVTTAAATATAWPATVALPQQRPSDDTKNFVLVPGSWHGAWCWAKLSGELRERGHQVFAITQTGLGDRKHLASAAVDINVFVDDIVNLIEAEEIENAILVGHSFGGIPITGAAARIPDRIHSLVYLDAGVPAPGDSALSPLSEQDQAARRKAAISIKGVDYLLPPNSLPPFWGLEGEDESWVKRRLTPHPFATYTSPLHFDDVAWARLPRTYIQCVAPRHPSLGESQARIKNDKSWKWAEISSGHDAMVSHPVELARLLLE